MDCSIKISECITQYLANVVEQVSDLVSKYKQNPSDESPGGHVRRVGIYCDGGCDCGDRYLSVGIEKLKEIESLRGKDSRTFIKTRTELICGNDRGHNKLDSKDSSSKSKSSSKSFDSEIQTVEFNYSQCSLPEKNPQTKIPIEYVNEYTKLQVKVDMFVQGKLKETPIEKKLVDGEETQKLEQFGNEVQKLVDGEETKNLEEFANVVQFPPSQEVIAGETYEENEIQNEDDQKENDESKGNEEKPPVSLKSDDVEIDIDIEWLENERLTATKEGSRTESEIEDFEINLRRARTTSELEYQRFINEFENGL